MLGPLLRIDTRAVLKNGNLLGRLIETLVLNQLRPELEASEDSYTLYHLRVYNGRHEIDVIAERNDGLIVAIEIKSSAAPTLKDAKHLRWLQDTLGERMHLGVVLHTGPQPYLLDERIWALPIASLWT